MDRSQMDVRHHAFEFIEELERLSDTTSIMDAMAEMLGQHGFEYFCCAFNAPKSTERAGEAVLAERLPAGFLDCTARGVSSAMIQLSATAG